ncbi:hypothetical protein SLS62_010979 [Diatrype stigma]|uniref:HMG box domain-containing protein n=1 Tax=Diatrype stigma TaxID=117547 RepID=A0AAN9U923_9PEZI
MQNPGLKAPEVSKIASKMWASLSRQEKKVWKGRADRIAAEFKLKHPEWRPQRRNSSEIIRRAQKQVQASHGEVAIAKDLNVPHPSENATVIQDNNIWSNDSAPNPDVGILENNVSSIDPQDQFSFQPDADFNALFGTGDEEGSYEGDQTWGSLYGDLGL